MGPTGQFLVYQAMYPTTAQGTLMGTAQIDATPNVHAVTGSLTWSRPVQATTIKVYQTGWVTPLELDVTGGLYVKPATGAVVMGAKVPSLTTPLVYNSTINSTITFFSDSGIPTSASAVNPNLNGNNTLPVLQGLRINSPGTVVAPTLATAGVLTTANPGSVTLLVNSATGSFSGSFKLKDGAVLRTVLYSGLIVPDVTTTANTLDAVGAGSYLLTGNPATAPDSTKSGRVTLLPIP